MKVLSLDVSLASFESPFQIMDEENDANNWITVFIGENGTKKSLLLRLLVEAGLFSKVYKGHGHPGIRCSLNLNGEAAPKKVIAISGTPFDRFPRGGTRDWHKKSMNAYEKKGYVYLGQRAANGVVGTTQNEKTLSSVFIRYADRLLEQSIPLTRVFNHLKLQPALGIRVKRPNYLNVKTAKAGAPVMSRLRYEAYVRGLPEKLNELGASRVVTIRWLKQMEFFIEQLQNEDVSAGVMHLLEELHESQIAFWLTPDAHKISRKNAVWKSLSDWRCAIDLGLVEVEGLNLAKMDEAALPMLAKDAVRDSDLSSGQWNWLSSLAGLTLELQDYSLVLIDEPENSLHPSWQREYIQVLSEVMNSRNHCHAVIATHSPFIASGLSETMGNVRSLKMVHLDKDDQWKVHNSVVAPSYGWAANDVYQDVFGMNSTRAPEFVERADLALRILSEGRLENAAQLREIVEMLKIDFLKLPAYDIMREILMDIISDAASFG
ncbi:AAA family ATPase [Duganella sp. HH101]|uniref:AAA family ATPase n=1 Tax=Duganella sp. HH101 TaxID=1781066 RepID=UPI00089411B4|nr:AAA family ATPase [Duganella sp. HH101]OEZ98156.1 hypothetical protein DUGA2_57260 [Duganella sp. HH101]